MSQDKPSGVAAAQAAATDIGLAIQTVEGFPAKQLQWEMVGKDTDGTPIYRNNWGEYSPWISVTERLPDKSEPVLLWCPPEDDEDTWLTYCDIGRYSHTTNGNHWFDTDDGGAFPTHWMPLPKPPKTL